MSSDIILFAASYVLKINNFNEFLGKLYEYSSYFFFTISCLLFIFAKRFRIFLSKNNIKDVIRNVSYYIYEVLRGILFLIFIYCQIKSFEYYNYIDNISSNKNYIVYYNLFLLLYSTKITSTIIISLYFPKNILLDIFYIIINFRIFVSVKITLFINNIIFFIKMKIYNHISKHKEKKIKNEIDSYKKMNEDLSKYL